VQLCVARPAALHCTVHASPLRYITVSLRRNFPSPCTPRLLARKSSRRVASSCAATRSTRRVSVPRRRGTLTCVCMCIGDAVTALQCRYPCVCVGFLLPGAVVQRFDTAVSPTGGRRRGVVDPGSLSRAHSAVFPELSR
jgi:hypothetical protein